MYMSVKVSSLAGCAIYTVSQLLLPPALSTDGVGGWVSLVWYVVLRGQYAHGVGMSGGMSRVGTHPHTHPHSLDMRPQGVRRGNDTQ